MPNQLVPDTADDSLGGASVGERLQEIAKRVGETIAGPASFEVDRDARFPHEAIDALRRERVLSALVPVERGGMGATVTDVSNAIRVLARHCAATGSVLAMHTIEVFLLLKFGNTPAFQNVIDELVERQLLIANANSEVGLSGDVTRSLTALVPDGDGWLFEKHALAASYARSADLIASTARRTPDAAETDQVTVLFRAREFTLEPTSEWDTLGLRGTCSSSLQMRGHVNAENIFPVPFPEIANGGGGQLRHVLLTAVWTGLAEAALEDAHTAVRAKARSNPSEPPHSAVRLAEMVSSVQGARAVLAQALLQVEDVIVNGEFDDIALTMSLRHVKVITSTVAVETATAALQICGIKGFTRGSRLERIIRDAHGGLIMVSNDRYLLENAEMLPLRKRI